MKQKIAFTFWIAYTTIMGLGMYLMHYVFHYSYEKPDMAYVMIWVEVLLSLLCIYVVKKYYSWEEVGFGKLNKKFGYFFLIFLVLVFLNLWVSISYVFSRQATTPEINLFLVLGFMTIMVGFSEELAFRGIILHSLLKKYNVLVSMSISAVVFSLFHAVNVLGGESIEQVMVQLATTFLFGCFFALMMVHLKNIIPLMLFHWLYDYSLFGAEIWNLEMSPFLVVLMVLMLLTTLVGWGYEIYKLYKKI